MWGGCIHGFYFIFFLFYLLFCSSEGWKEGEVNGFEAPVRDMMREGGKGDIPSRPSVFKM